MVSLIIICFRNLLACLMYTQGMGLPSVCSFSFLSGFLVLVFPPQAHSHFASEKRFFICGDLFLSPPPIPSTEIFYLW